MTDDEFTDPWLHRAFAGNQHPADDPPVSSSRGFRSGGNCTDFELPNHLGETVSFHADRDGSQALLFPDQRCGDRRALRSWSSCHNNLPELAAEGIKLWRQLRRCRGAGSVR